jgi:hypothetical protein
MAVRKMWSCIAVVVALSFVAPLAHAGDWVFSVSPGNTLGSAQIGRFAGHLMPYVGFDLMGVTAKGTYNSEYTETMWNGYSYDVLRVVETEELNGSARLFIPHFGARFYLGDLKNEVRPYLFGDFLKSFASVDASGTVTGKAYLNNVLEESQTEKTSIDSDTKKQVEKLLGIYGLTLGFGADYSFSEHFALGGEFALHYYHASVDNSSGKSGAAAQYDNLLNNEMSASLKLTQGRIMANYRF